MKTVNKERLDKVVALMKDSAYKASHGGSSGTSTYSFASFIKLNKINTEGMQERGDEISIPCPFHTDFAPSFSYNEKLGKCHCFSCGFGGSYLSFALEYTNKILGYSLTKAQYVNECLVQDPILASEAGFQTIYDFDDYTPLESFKRQKFTPNALLNAPSSYLELATYLQKHGVSEEIETLFILYMQDGIPADQIYHMLFSNDKDLYKVTTDQPVVDFLNINTEDFVYV